MLKYWLWLTTRTGLGNQGMHRVLQYFGTPEQAYCADREAYQKIEGLKDFASLEDKSMTEAQKILNDCYRKNIHILTWCDAAYPERLRNIDTPPIVLYYQGTIPAFDTEPVIAMVGTRKASAYGMTQSKHLAYRLSRVGVVLVSGGAHGIDTMAIRGAISTDTPCVVVMGCGLDVVYPASNRELFEDVRTHGCLMSEYPPGTPALPEHFPVRNRIISGLALGVVVVEAPLKSGALITARWALDQGRDVFAVPANADSPAAAGNLQLIKDGAIVVTECWDVLKEYTNMFPDLAKHEPYSFPMMLSAHEKRMAMEIEKKKVASDPVTEENFDTKNVDKPEKRAYIDVQEISGELTDDEKIIARILTDGPVHIDNIVSASGLPTGRVLASMTLLEVKGFVRRLPARMFSLAEK